MLPAQVPGKASEEEMRRLMAAYGTMVKRLCTLYLKDASLAEDAAQETFIKVWKGWGSFRGDSAERTWLTQIALRTCRDLQRSAWLRHVDRRQPIEELPLAAPAPTDAMNDIVRAIQELPAHLRAPVILHLWQGLTLKETAETLGLNQNTVASRVNRAKKRLQTALEGVVMDG